ncbi:MAG TPA: HPr kinase/phosphatase C-terminal domain-containing protein [Rhizomicrobium sp.]|nr:HPr kinase/phosphatase C-terminal domain-containing protein [Rhizomicrobium sp.]
MSEVNIHASCVAVGSQGVLLIGASAAGKSDLALRLIDEGAKLVADDRTILFTAKGLLHARAPASIKGLIEIRGLGIVELPVRANVKIALVVKLGREDTRLPTPRLYRAPARLTLAASPPQIALDARFASTPAKIRAALAAFSKGAFRDTFHLN